MARTVSYGDDPWTKRVGAQVREIFETDCEVFFVFNGTAANSLCAGFPLPILSTGLS